MEFQQCRDCGASFPYHPDADRCAICVIAQLEIGEGFRLKGRSWKISDHRGVSFYSEHSAKGERGVFKCWNAKGREVLVTVRPDSRIEL